MRANAVGKICSVVDSSYIAGFLDADGAIMASIESHPGKRFGFRVRVEVKITQQDREVLDWIQSVLGVGIVRVNRLSSDRQTFDLHIRDTEQVRFVIEMLLPYLHVKKQQAEIALKILNSPVESKEDLIKNAESADALSRFNVRSKNRRKNFVTKIQEHVSPND